MDGNLSNWTFQKGLKWTVCESGRRSRNPKGHKLNGSQIKKWTVLRDRSGRSKTEVSVTFQCIIVPIELYSCSSMIKHRSACFN